jgi:hypothetical protein
MPAQFPGRSRNFRDDLETVNTMLEADAPGEEEVSEPGEHEEGDDLNDF